MLKKIYVATFGTILFLFALNYINTEIAKDNFLPLFVLFVITVIIWLVRWIRWSLRRKQTRN
ncbi:hypothetical protein CHI10_16945 [Bacillus sp. 7894-2]|nr:hypothetical protein CHI10_16945 [Bacillus sp. 7894-2]